MIVFDFPTNVTDYLHRVGRTARALAKGTATMFVTKKDLPLANAIQVHNLSH